MIDEDFQYFLDSFTPQGTRYEVPGSSMERYRGRLPDQLLRYWDQFGWSSYAYGLFSIVNPQEYEPVLTAWLEGTKLEHLDNFHVVARSAFGELIVWGEKFGYCLTISTQEFYAITVSDFRHVPEDMDFEIQCFFPTRKKAAFDFDQMFEGACTRLGYLAVDEIYAFVPALALGGAREIENLQKVSAIEHLMFLAELEDLRFMDLLR